MAEGTADVFIIECIALWGCPMTLLSNEGLQFCSKLLQAVYRHLKNSTIATTVAPFTLRATGAWSVLIIADHTVAQMMSMVVIEQKNDWDVHLPHVAFAYSNSVSAATALAPNKIHAGRLPRLPLVIFRKT